MAKALFILDSVCGCRGCCPSVSRIIAMRQTGEFERLHAEFHVVEFEMLDGGVEVLDFQRRRAAVRPGLESLPASEGHGVADPTQRDVQDHTDRPPDRRYAWGLN